MPLSSRFLPAVVAILFALGAFATAAATASSDGPPQAQTKTPTALTTSSAALHALVDPNNRNTSAWFEIGTTTSYNKFTSPVSVGHGGSNVAVDTTVTGLAPATTYHVRVAAMNDRGVARGADMTFVTAAAAAAPPTTPTTPGAAPTPTDPQSPSPTPVAAPQLGHSVNVTEKAGTVLVRMPGARTTVPLSATASVPVGAILDTREGTIELKTALTGDRTQSATIHGGVFEVRQPAKQGGLTDLILRGPAPSCKAGGAQASATAKKRQPARNLWASDNHGRFRTRGSNAVATVRGTSWYMADRCDGTYTRVKRGSVAVRDLHSGRTFILHAGQSHLARPAR